MLVRTLTTITAVGLASLASAKGFHIDKGDAVDTLNEFSRQSDLQILFDYNVVQGHKTQSIDGDFTDKLDALRALLAKSDLVYDLVNHNTLAVVPLVKGYVALRDDGIEVDERGVYYCGPIRCPELWWCRHDYYTQTFFGQEYSLPTDYERCTEKEGGELNEMSLTLSQSND